MSFDQPTNQNKTVDSSTANQTQQPEVPRPIAEMAYVGDRYHAFEEYFDLYRSTGGRAFFNFSWAGFFLGIFWMLYRKMYLEGFIIFAICTFIYLLGLYFDFSTENLSLLQCIYIAVDGRRLYWKSMNRRIDRAYQMYQGQNSPALAWLKNHGGTNLWIVILGLIIVIAAFMIDI